MRLAQECAFLISIPGDLDVVKANHHSSRNLTMGILGSFEIASMCIFLKSAQLSSNSQIKSTAPIGLKTKSQKAISISG